MCLTALMVRYFIMTPGRTGSSLLCSILSDAGADFGPVDAGSWDRNGGAFELPEIAFAAMNWQHRRWWGRREARKALGVALGKAQFFKSVFLERLIDDVASDGYKPIII